MFRFASITFIFHSYLKNIHNYHPYHITLFTCFCVKQTECEKTMASIFGFHGTVCMVQRRLLGGIWAFALVSFFVCVKFWGIYTHASWYITCVLR